MYCLKKTHNKKDFEIWKKRAREEERATRPLIFSHFSPEIRPYTVTTGAVTCNLEVTTVSADTFGFERQFLSKICVTVIAWNMLPSNEPSLCALCDLKSLFLLVLSQYDDRPI